MSTPSLYVIGGAGTGKSTFMRQLLDGRHFGPLVDLWTKPNARGTVITLRGHRLDDGGLYLGVDRPEFPGSDGLDRASSITGEAWLEAGRGDEYPYVVGEGATLATRRFLLALHARTDLYVIHLWAEDFVKELRFLQRGSNQDPRFVTATATRAANLAKDIRQDHGVRCHWVDSSRPDKWDFALSEAREHLGLSKFEVLG